MSQSPKNVTKDDTEIHRGQDNVGEKVTDGIKWRDAELRVNHFPVELIGELT